MVDQEQLKLTDISPDSVSSHTRPLNQSNLHRLQMLLLNPAGHTPQSEQLNRPISHQQTNPLSQELEAQRIRKVNLVGYQKQISLSR